MTKLDKIFFLVIGLFVVAAIVFWKDFRGFVSGDKTVKTEISNNEKKKNRKSSKHDDNVNNVSEDSYAAFSPGLSIEQRWDLPAELKEISGIAHVDEQRFLCVQDEEGILYTYNAKTNQIEKKVRFTGKGDFEGISLVGSTAYVLRADGTIFEVGNVNSASPTVKQYTTPLNAQNDCEGIEYDKKENRLLITVKESATKDSNPIFSFDLNSKKMKQSPAIEIDFGHKVFNQNEKKKARGIRPSSLAIHPSTGEYYILEGTNPKLLVLDKQANPKKLFVLNKKNFVQPEGLTFTPTGDLYISNEGAKGNANILKVSVD